MKKAQIKIFLQIIVILCLSFTILITVETYSRACDVLVVSGRVTTNGRPFIWKNRDCSPNWHQEINYFSEEYPLAGGYLMVYNYDDIAELNNGTPINPSGGINDAGFAISCTSVYEDFNPFNEFANINTDLLRESLQKCSNLEDFEELLRNWRALHPGKVINGNFVAIDAHGGAALYECWTGLLGGSSTYLMYTKFDANNGSITEYTMLQTLNVIDEGEGDNFVGFFVRANNNGYISINYGDERMYRAEELCNNLIEEGRMNYRNVLREVTKDVVGDQSYHEETSETNYSTTYCISRNQTRLGMVVDGVSAGEDPALTTFWCALGEPSVAVYIPYYSRAMGVSELCYIDGIGIDGTLYNFNDTCMLNRASNRREIYDNLIYKSNTGDIIDGMDNRIINKVELRKAQEWTFLIEDFVLDKTEDYIDDMRDNPGLITTANLRQFSDYCVNYVYENYNEVSAVYYAWSFEKPW